MRIFFHIVIFLTCIQPVLSQELSLNSQIFMNPYYYNPAYAGFEDRPAFYIYRRQQWTEIEGAPVTTGFNFHTIFNKKVNFGVHIQSDKRSILSTTSALVTLGYRASFGEFHYISFAASGGIGFNNIDLDAVDTDDPAIAAALAKNMFLDGNAGIAYYNNGFNLGFSLPKIFKSKLLSSEAFKVGEINPLNDVIVMASYRWEISERQFAIEPYLNYFYNKDLPGQFEIIGRVHLGDAFWIGTSYRQDYGLTGFLGLNLKDNIKFGYAYDFFDAKPARFNNSTHDLQLALIVGEKKKKGKISMISKRRSMLKAMGRLPSQQNKNMYKPKPKPKPEPTVKTETYNEDQALQDLLNEMNEEETTPQKQPVKEKPDSIINGESKALQELLDEMAKEESVPKKAPKIHNTVAPPAAKTESTENTALQDLLDEMAVEEKAKEKVVVVNEIKQTKDEPVPEKSLQDLLDEMEADEKPSGNIPPPAEIKQSEPVAKDTVNIFNFQFDDDLITEKEQPKELSAEESLVNELNENESDEITIDEEEALTKTEEYVEPSLDDEGLYIGPTSVIKGDHLLELEKGNYLVVGTFNSYRDSEEYSDKLFIEGFYTKFGYISQTKIYYVYIFKSDDKQEASDTSDRFKEIGAKFRENWVLEVQ